jgi:hypothetical protein
MKNIKKFEGFLDSIENAIKGKSEKGKLIGENLNNIL